MRGICQDAATLFHSVFFSRDSNAGITPLCRQRTGNRMNPHILNGFLFFLVLFGDPSICAAHRMLRESNIEAAEYFVKGFQAGGSA